jgi:hypothetical protein
VRVKYKNGTLHFSTPTRSHVEVDNVWDALTIVHNEIRPINGERTAYVQALRIIGLCATERGHIEAGRWLLDLAEALEELENGVEWPVLRRSKVGHRHPYPVYIQNGQAFVALGVEALVRSGVAPKAAAKEALRQIKTIPRDTESATILGWRSELKKKRKANKRGAKTFRLHAQELEDKEFFETFYPRLADLDEVRRLKVMAAHYFRQAGRLLGKRPHS